MIARSSQKVSTNSTIDEQRLREQTAREAYAIYEKRGRTDGRDIDDWLTAERQVRGTSAFATSAATAKPAAKSPAKASRNGSRVRRGKSSSAS